MIDLLEETDECSLQVAVKWKDALESGSPEKQAESMTFLLRALRSPGMGAAWGWDMMSELKVRKSLWGCEDMAAQRMGRFEEELIDRPLRHLPVYHSLFAHGFGRPILLDPRATSSPWRTRVPVLVYRLR